MLNEVAPAGAVLADIGQELSNHIELVIAGKDLYCFLFTCLLVLCFDHLGIVLEDVCQPITGEDLLPQVSGFETVRVGRIAGAVVPAPVEWQKPGSLPLELRAHPHLVVVDGELHDTASELEKPLAGVAVALVLQDGVLDRLLREAVFQFKGSDRQTIDEQAQIERELRLVTAVAKLSDNDEAILSVVDCSRLVAR